MTSNHVYPASLHGVAAAQLVHDELVKGLAELGHEVVQGLRIKNVSYFRIF